MIPKFRFFDTEERNMYEVESVNGRGCKNKSGKDVFVISIEGESVKECPYELAEWRSFSDGVLMQSTGLKDKHGVEIFEGDVVKTKYGEHGRHIGVVKYGGAKFYSNGVKQYLSWHEDLNGLFEIIGNRYEHPYLLEE